MNGLEISIFWVELACPGYKIAHRFFIYKGFDFGTHFCNRYFLLATC